MTQFVIANNVNTQLAAAASSSATTLTLASSANLPALSAGQVMPLVLNDAATGLYYEVVYVTAISGVTLTVLRAQESTSALNWSLGDYAYCAPTQGTVATLYGNASAPFFVGTATLTTQAAQLGQTIGVYATAPSSEVGPVIFAQDRQQEMIWQTIGTFTGYASPLVGLFHWGTTTTPRPFEELLIGSTIDSTLAKYKALIAWANVQGLVVSAASWVAGTYNFGDNGDGTIILPDLRNQFIRATGTDVDTANARELGSTQSDATQKITGTIGDILNSQAYAAGAFATTTAGNQPYGTATGGNYYRFTFDSGRVTRSSTETRGANVALGPMVFL